MELDLLLRGVIAPVLAAVATMSAFSRDSTRGRGVALAVALIVSCMAQETFDAIPPLAAWQWVPLAVLCATLVGVAAGERGVDRVGRAVACALAAAVACVLLPLPEWGSAESRILLCAGVACASILLLPLGMHRGGISFWTGLAVAFAGTAAMILATGFAKLAVPVGAVGMVCGVLAVRAWTVPHRTLHAGIAGTITIVTILGLASAAAFAFQTSSLPGWIPALAAAAPLGLWMGEAPPFRGGRMASGMARVLGAAIPAILAALAAMTHAPATEASIDAYALRDDASTNFHPVVGMRER